MKLLLVFLSMFILANAAAITGAADDNLDITNLAKKPCRICNAYVNKCAKGGKSFAQCRHEVCVAPNKRCRTCPGMGC
ncbi:hypothetical protein NX059_004773 [Plenodomus lindquistii]|nr:hypothetical protein NX059_004773 [Plenodomus lindquistii]